MTIQVVCACGKSLKAPDGMAGKKARCPACGAELLVPPPGQAPRSPAGQAPRSAPPPQPPAEEDPFGIGSLLDEPMPAMPTAAPLAAANPFRSPTIAPQKKARKQSSPADGDLTTFEIVVCIVCANIGCICAVVYLITGNPKGRKMFLYSLAGQGAWFLLGMAANLLTRG